MNRVRRAKPLPGAIFLPFGGFLMFWLFRSRLMPLIPPSDSFPFFQLPIVGVKIKALLGEIKAAGFGYLMGAKIVPITLQSPDLMGQSEDGTPVKGIDCSGFVRWVVWHACGVLMPDGSAQQHQWAIDEKLKPSTVEDAMLRDGVIRYGFLKPKYENGIEVEAGHVILILDGYTLESHGHLQGPDSRVFDPSVFPFMAEMDIFVAGLGVAA